MDWRLVSTLRLGRCLGYSHYITYLKQLKWLQEIVLFMPSSPLDIAGFISSLAGGIVGGVAGQNEIQWNKGLLMKILEEAGKAQEQGRQSYLGYTNDFYPNLLNSLFSTQSQLHGPDGFQSQLGNQLSSQNASIPSLYNNLNAWQGTNNAAAQSTIDIAKSLAGTQGLAQDVFAGGGWTPQYQYGFDTIQKFLESPLAGQGQAMSTMGNLFSTNGATDFTSALQNAGRQSLSNGGFTPTLNAAGAPLMGILNQNGDTQNNDILRRFGNQALTTGGYTANSGAGSNTALQGVQSGGRTGTTDALQGRGLELLNREALLPLQQVLSMARDGAGAAGLNAAERARREAINRGGGAGATVANGMQNQGFAEFADQIARNESDAANKALLGQQDLQQKEQLAGGSIAAQGADAERNRLGVFANLLNSLEQGATSRYGTGGQLANAANENETQRILSAIRSVSDLQDSATRNMGTVGGLGVQGAGLEQGNLDIAAKLLQTITGNDLSKTSIGLNNLNSLSGNQNQYALGAGTLANQSANTQGNLFGNLLQNSIQGGQLNLSGINGLVNAILGGQQNSLSYNGQLNNSWANVINGAQGLMSPWMQYANNGLGTMGGLAGGTHGQNPYANLGK
jgi:hypothetical protein